MNPYRCENCTKEDCWYFKMRDDSRNFKDKYGELLSPSSFTWEKGCASHSEFICQGKKVMDLFVSLITSEMVYDDGDMYYKVNPEKYVEVLGRIVSGDEP